MGTKCQGYETCRETTIAAEKKVHEGVKIDEAARKAMHVSGTMVLCFLKVFEAAAKDAPAKLKACKDKAAPDTSHLVITYPAVPAETPCDTSPVSTYPCEKAWIDTHYGSRSWLNNAKTKACTPCAPVPGLAGKSGPSGWTMGKFGENCETTCGAGNVDTAMMQKLIDNRRDYKAVNAAFVAAGIKCRNRNGVIATGGQPWEPSFEGESGVEKCWNRPDGVTKCQTPAEPNCFGPGTNWKFNYGPALGRTFPYNTRALCPCKAAAVASGSASAAPAAAPVGKGYCGKNPYGDPSRAHDFIPHEIK